MNKTPSPVVSIMKHSCTKWCTDQRIATNLNIVENYAWSHVGPVAITVMIQSTCLVFPFCLVSIYKVMSHSLRMNLTYRATWCAVGLILLDLDHRAGRSTIHRPKFENSLASKASSYPNGRMTTYSGEKRCFIKCIYPSVKFRLRQILRLLECQSNKRGSDQIFRNEFSLFTGRERERTECLIIGAYVYACVEKTVLIR